MVHKFDGSLDFTAWGTCTDSTSTFDWCCAIDDSSGEIDNIVLRGSDLDDTLEFQDGVPPSFKRLQEHVTNQTLNAEIQGRGDVDTINGSSRDSSFYHETLIGNTGNDIIDGFGGADLIKGGAGDDTLSGGAGNDRITGYDGDDDLNGDGGNDTLCDSSVASDEVTCEPDFFDGGDGDDIFWYAYKSSCSSSGALNGASDADPNTDACGPLDWGSNPIWTGCDNDQTSEPSTCP